MKLAVVFFMTYFVLISDLKDGDRLMWFSKDSFWMHFFNNKTIFFFYVPFKDQGLTTVFKLEKNSLQIHFLLVDDYLQIALPASQQSRRYILFLQLGSWYQWGVIAFSVKTIKS